MSERIEKGPNSVSPNRVIKDPIKIAVKKALGTDYQVSMTQTETLAIEIERTGSKELSLQFKEISSAVGAVQELQSKIRGDMTRNDTEKLQLLNKKAKSRLEHIDKSVNHIATVAMRTMQEAKEKLFTSNIGLNAVEQSMLPQIAQMLSKDEASLAIGTATESEAKLLLHMLENFPSMVNEKQFNPSEELQGIKQDFNSRFSPEPLGIVMSNYEVTKAVKDLIPALSKAKSSSLPSELLASLTSTRVA